MNTSYLCNTIGRRKESTARLFVKAGLGNIQVNEKSLNDYFYMDSNLSHLIYKPLKLFEKEKAYDIKVNVRGGGISSQAGAIVLGVARALVKMSPEYRVVLKKNGLLTCDSRVKERRKVGLLKARKRPPFVKR